MEVNVKWPLSRMWSLTAPSAEARRIATAELFEIRALSLRGAAGLGKTFELSGMAAADRRVGRDVRFARLAEFAHDLSGQLDKFIAGATGDTVVYLDALDEAMVAQKTAALPLASWIRSSLASIRPRLRISCRGAVWPTVLTAAMQEAYGDPNCAVADLEPISESDVAVAAEAAGISALAFKQAVQDASAMLLARHPITLMMLLRLFKRDRVLPARRSELFRRGVQELASERPERQEVGTGTDFSAADILDAAEWVACVLLLSGRDCVTTREHGSATSLEQIELLSLPAAGAPLGEGRLRALSMSGLCEGHAGEFRFVHRQIAEYLAGRRLARSLPHQALALLSAEAGSRSGVAGPLRETASFAANESNAVADWIADSDPEVIGVSDVTSDEVRRRATQRMLEKFRNGELVDAQLGRDGEYAGLRYPAAEADLRPVLRERGPQAGNVLDFAVTLAAEWALSGLSDDLADLALDPSAPLRPRIQAGYALREFGSPAARRRIKPLIVPGPEDEQWQLKGLALRCNWPDNLETRELLTALERAPTSSFHGAYQGFLLELDREGFSAAAERVTGMNWAAGLLRRGDFGDFERIVKKIAHGAARELSDAATLGALADLLIAGAKRHCESPLGAIKAPGAFLDASKPAESEPPLVGNQAARRALLEALAARVTEQDHFWWQAFQTPGLMERDDFAWLIERSMDKDVSTEQRRQFAEAARALFSWEDAENVELWLANLEIEPVRSVLNFPILVELDSDTARRQRRDHQRASAAGRRGPRPIHPPPSERVAAMLGLCESKDARYWNRLSDELRLDASSGEYEFKRFLTNSAGWSTANEATRARVLSAAKRFLDEETESTRLAESEALNQIRIPGMAAIWLVSELDPAWLEDRTYAWWGDWAWYMLRELHLNMHEEPPEPKAGLFATLCRRVPDVVEDRIIKLAESSGDDSRHLLVSLFELLGSDGLPEIDERLCDKIAADKVTSDKLDEVTGFVLARNPTIAEPVCISMIKSDAATVGDERIGQLCKAMLAEGGPDSRVAVFHRLTKGDGLAKRVLGDFALMERPRGREGRQLKGPIAWPADQVGVLARLLFSAFPPESDPPNEGARWIGVEESARDLRDQLITQLANDASGSAVAALRNLEVEFGARYPWLRHPRAQAERRYFLSRWTPTPAAAVAEVLRSENNRLLRSPQDALDAICASLVAYQRALLEGTPREVEDLWNTPSKSDPTPKIEERVSDKICQAIRRYLSDYGVVAEREVQVSRRVIRTDAGGRPGSEVDVFVRLPTSISSASEPIVVLIEVKRSANDEAKTGLRAQLVDRYMAEAGTGAGVYVVAWFDAPNLPIAHAPKWASISLARDELVEQAIAASIDLGVDVRGFVIDASLK